MKKKIAAIITAAAMLTSCPDMSVYAENTDAVLTDDTAAVPEDDGDVIAVPAEDSEADAGHTAAGTLPRDMRAAVITPSVDFGDDDPELDAAYDEFARMGLNAVVIAGVSDDTAYYDLDRNTGDLVQKAAERAYSHGISPYVVLDLGSLMSGTDGDIDTLVSRVHRFTLANPCEGIIIDNYYIKRDINSFCGYMRDGSGIGYVNWLYDTSERYFRTAAEVIRETDSSTAAGIMINDMWANASTDPAGSATEDYFEAYSDGYTDTRRFIGNSYADFAMVRAYGSMTSVKLPFAEVTGWWGNVTASADIPMYVIHHNEYVGTDTVGWKDGEQLTKQVTALGDIGSFSGSVFNSFSALESDPLGSTTALVEYYGTQAALTAAKDDPDEPEDPEAPEETDGEETADAPAADEDNEPAEELPPPPKDLKMTSPSSLVFTTTEASVTFMGTIDETEPVYFNGTAMKLNGAGNFYFEQPLEAGLNTFKISHKDKTYTYSITRRITVLKSIDSAIGNGKSLSVDGGTRIKLNARAYKGSVVYGMINGTKVTMQEKEGTADEEESNSTYVRFSGVYTVPEGIIGQTQSLGTIKICGSYAGYSMEATGASVTVNALPEPPKPVEAVTVTEGVSQSGGDVIAELAPPHKEGEALKYIKTLANDTIVYDGKTVDDIPSPLFSQLPAGVLEVYRSTSGSYYVSESGKRIASSISALIDGTAITENKLLVRSIGTSNGSSYIKIKTDHKTGFNMRLVGNNYYTAWDGDYNVSDFTATHLYITFENITSVTSLPSFEYSQVFRSGKWDTVTEENGTKFRLILELRQPGVYFGQTSRYDDEGCLILSFSVPVNSLAGMTIVIDPGHGYGKSADKLDPGAIGEVVEQEVVLAIAKELTEQLTAAGASAVRLKTESEFLLTKDRPNYARQYGCDLFIAIHANKATGDARGVEAYYFTSYSEPLAAAISKEIAKYYQYNVYSDGADKDRGARYSYYHVTLQQDFPSILLETGFVDNIQDAMALASPTHRKGIAAAIVQGIKNYLARSSISSYISGYSAATPANTAEPAETAAPEETTITAPEETTVPEETAGPEETTVPGETASPEDTVSTEEPMFTGVTEASDNATQSDEE
ncbi:MAG: N-acetylmuramoyl-L-alanine amidase [Ruminiclostridium sp.]|nr:N-acetylmuramoyl-L-alanine amidase [Ruminiclostridium sp.]